MKLDLKKTSLLLLCLSLFKLSATSLDGTSNIIYTTNPQVFHDGEFAKGFVALKKGFTVPSMSGARLNLVMPASYGMDLRTTGSIILENNLRLDAGFTLSSSGTICGNGYSLILNDDLIIPSQSTLKITSTLVIDGNNHVIFFDNYSQILVDRHATLTLKNIILKNSFNNSTKPVIGTAGNDSKVTFDNVIFNLNDDFFFNQGSFFIHNDVDFKGNTSFYYTSSQTSFIAPQSTFYFDNGSRFFYNPQTTSDNLIIMQDPSSTLFFDGSTLRSTPTGLVFNNGNLYFDNKVYLDAGVSLTVSTYQLAEIPYTTKYLGSISTTKWHPNGKYLALGGGGAKSGLGGFDNTDCVRIYEFDISTPPYFFPTISIPNGTSLAWRSDGEYLAVASTGIDFTSTLSIYKFNLSPIELTPITAIPIGANIIDWHPSGEYLSIVDGGTQASIYFFNQKQNSLDLFTTTSTSADYTTINNAKWNNTGEYLAIVENTFSSPTLVKIFYFDQFNQNPNSRLQEFTSVNCTIYSGSEIRDIDWRDDGRYLAIIGSGISLQGNNELIYEFNPASIPSLTFVTGYKDNNEDTIRWSPNNNTLLSGGLREKFESDEGIWNYATSNFNPNNVSTYNKIDPIANQNIRQDSGYSISEDWNPDGSIFSVGLPLSAFIYKYIEQNQKLVVSEVIQNEPINHGINSVNWHPNKKNLAIAGYGAGPTEMFNNYDEIRLYKFNDISNQLSPVTSKSFGNYSVNSIDLHDEDYATGNSSNDETANFVSKIRWDSFATMNIAAHYTSPEFGGRINSVKWIADTYIAAAGANSNNSIKIYQDTGSALTFNVESPNYGGAINSISTYNNPTYTNYIATGGINAGYTVKLYQFIPGVSLNQIAESSTGYGGKINVVCTKVNDAWEDIVGVMVGGANAGNTIQMYRYDGITFDMVGESINCGGQINDLKSTSGFNLFACGDWGGIKFFAISWNHGSESITQISESPIYPNPIKSIALYGDFVFSIESNTNIIRVHSLPGWTLLAESQPSTININAFTITSDFFMVLGDENNLIKLYADYGEGRVLYKGIQSVPISVNSSAWSPSGNFFAVGGIYASNGGGFANNDELRIYHFYKNELYPVTSQAIGSEVNALSWHPSEKYLATVSDSEIAIYSFDGTNLSLVTNYALVCDAISWSPDGKFLAATESGAGTFKVLEFTDESSLSSICSAEGIFTLDWSSDGKYIITSSNPPDLFFPPNLLTYSFNGSSLSPVYAETQPIARATTKIKFAKDAHSIASTSISSDFGPMPNSVGGSQLFYFDGSQYISASTKSIDLSANALDWRDDESYIGIGNDNWATDVWNYPEAFTGAPDLLIYQINYLANYLEQPKGLDLDKNLNVNVLGNANVNINGIVNFNKN